jgi:hypothetical protein
MVMTGCAVSPMASETATPTRGADIETEQAGLDGLWGDSTLVS